MVALCKEAEKTTSGIQNTIENDDNCGNSPRTVLRGVNSQKIGNTVGIHWLRISVRRCYLRGLRDYVSKFYGEYDRSEYGLWSYDSCYAWVDGLTLNYDSDVDRNARVHKSKITLDICGSALDLLTADVLMQFVHGLARWSPTCSRIDVFFDDYNRIKAPSDLIPLAQNRDFTGFRKATTKQRFGVHGIEHDEVSFGVRGENGSGKYLRVYDKELESKGKFDCIRWETEFSQERANMVFEKLSEADTLEQFASLCGALIGGVITFVHRTGDKNIDRLDVYAFWSTLQDLLGSVVLRVKSEDTTVDTMQSWVAKQVSPTLACLRPMYRSDIDFFNWLLSIMEVSEEKQSKRHSYLAEKYKQQFNFFKENANEDSF